MTKLIHWIRRFTSIGNGTGSLRAAAGIRLGPHHAAHIVSFGSHRWVVVGHPQGLTELLHEKASDAAAGQAVGGHG